ncbi:MAG: hypothetical protein ABIJ15_07770 [bacterium]
MKEPFKKELKEYLPTFFHKLKEGSNLYNVMIRGMEALNNRDLSWSRLNQMFQLASQTMMSEGFYKYYFLDAPNSHPYPVKKVFSEKADFEPPTETSTITSMKQLQWGFHRFMFDAMLYYGNFKQAYLGLKDKTYDQLVEYYKNKCFDEAHLISRGSILRPLHIPRDSRYLISETACKNYEMKKSLKETEQVKYALRAFEQLRKEKDVITPEMLSQRTKEIAESNNELGLFELLYEEASSNIESEEEVIALYEGQWKTFKEAREKALENTRIFLSICSDLDVYVATSMRNRDDFREMAQECSKVFGKEVLEQYNIRYFDPTISAAQHHEDKGIIECLMVKCAKILLYCAQRKESLGKVSEYAIALSLGKPVIVLCPSDQKGMELFNFYRDKHPLLRLAELNTGIINGAMITHNTDTVTTLIHRLFSNNMEYNLERKPKTSYYLLKERLTQSTVRLVTDDSMLTEIFWGCYIK